MSSWNDDPLLRKSLWITVVVMGIIAIFALINIVYGLYTKFPTTFEEFLVSPVTNWNIAQVSLFAGAVAILANINFLKKRLTPWKISVENRLNNTNERLGDLEKFFGINVESKNYEKNPIELEHTMKSNMSSRSWQDYLGLAANVATVIALVILIYAIVDNKIVIEKLTDQLNESKKSVDLLTTIITNSYVDYKPNLVFLISPINATYKTGSDLHQFALDSYNYGKNRSLVNTTWEFGSHGCLNGSPINNLPIIRITDQVYIKNGDTDISEIGVPVSFGNVKNLTSFSAKLSMVEYPFDPTLGKITEYGKYNWTFLTFDYNSTRQVWFPHSATDFNTPCTKSSESNFYLQLNTSDNSMYSYEIVK